MLIITCRVCDEDMEFCDVINGVTIFRCNNCHYEIEVDKKEEVIKMDMRSYGNTKLDLSKISHDKANPTIVKIIENPTVQDTSFGSKVKLGVRFDGVLKHVMLRPDLVDKLIDKFGSESTGCIGNDLSIYSEIQRLKDKREVFVLNIV